MSTHRDPIRHTIKLADQYACAVVAGHKCYEVRWDDRDYRENDLVRFIPSLRHFRTSDSVLDQAWAYLRPRTFRITGILLGELVDGLSVGYVVLNLEECDTECHNLATDGTFLCSECGAHYYQMGVPDDGYVDCTCSWDHCPSCGRTVVYSPRGFMHSE